jgi:hypothetical protein
MLDSSSNLEGALQEYPVGKNGHFLTREKRRRTRSEKEHDAAPVD